MKFESQTENVTQSTVMNNTQDQQNLGIPSNLSMKEIEFLADN